MHSENSKLEMIQINFLAMRIAHRPFAATYFCDKVFSVCHSVCFPSCSQCLMPFGCRWSLCVPICIRKLKSVFFFTCWCFCIVPSATFSMRMFFNVHLMWLLPVVRRQIIIKSMYNPNIPSTNDKSLTKLRHMCSHGHETNLQKKKWNAILSWMRRAHLFEMLIA